MKFIVKFFPEIMVKGDSAKKRMVSQLFENLKNQFRRLDETIVVKPFRDKIEVFCEQGHTPMVTRILTHTPGIEQALQADQIEAQTLEQIAEATAQYALPLITDKTFVVRAKRSGQHEFTSFDIERFVGAYLCKMGQPAGVNLNHPQVKIELEYHHHQLNVITAKHRGLGGFPLGTQGEVLSLMSGGFDSTIASYLTLRRGMKTHFIFFNLGGAAHEIGVKQVALYLWNQFATSHRLQFISIPFEEVVDEIFRANHDSYMGVMLKRLMLMAAQKVADDMGIDALVTGESVAQVSSQTLRNLALIDQATDKLVLRPLATMDKPDIMRLADEIGTRHFAENMPEYCGVISKNPVTHGSFKRLLKEVEKFDYQVLDRAIEAAQMIAVDTIVAEVNQQQAVEIETNPKGFTVIDIRRPQETAASPLELSSILTIPFFEVNRVFKTLDQSQQYLLYCEKGVMSQLHAQYLRDMGFENVKVYRPA